MAATGLDHFSIRRPSAGGSRSRAAFVLSSGASLGALQLRMLQALYQHEIVPDLFVGIVGTALNPAFVATRPQSMGTASVLGRVGRVLQREDVFPVSISGLVGGLTGRRDHLVPDRGLRRRAQRDPELDDLSDAPIRLHLAAVDQAEGREVLLSQHPGRPMMDARIAAVALLARDDAGRDFRLAG